MDDLLKEFLTETSENLTRLNQEIIEIERSPGDIEILNSIFRTIHTIKGTCGFLGLGRLESVAHAAENVLDQARSGQLVMEPQVVTPILAAVDQITSILDGLEATGLEPSGDDSELIRRLEGLIQGPSAPVPPDARDDVESDVESDDASDPPEPEPHPAAPGSHQETSSPHPPPSPPESGAPDQTSMQSRDEPQGAAAEKQKPADGNPGKASISEQSLRVDVDILDRLMNMVGELVLMRNLLLQLVQTDEESIYASPIQQLNRVTSDLQEAVMKTRMQPIGNAWTKLPRLVRDLSQSSGKRIELVMRGAETELDRQVLQVIQDPLTHMVRNSSDHGIETPEVRRAAGKPAFGTLTLNSYHEGGHIIIEVSDDGAGVDVDKVRRKAVERGLVTAEAASSLTDSKLMQFIMGPGFSTAEKVTAVSGRGVGMDVVKTRIESIGGTVDLSSKKGEGATVHIKIPLTLAIISALVVGVGDESFAIPQIGVLELVRIAEDNRHLIEEVHGSQVLRLRDRLLPLVHLGRVLELPQASGPEDLIIVVAQVGENRFGLVVDEVIDMQEIVVKPIGRILKDIALFSGTTILGDGSVIMILDIAGIGAKAGALTEATDLREDDIGVAGRAADDENITSLLLFSSGDQPHQALPLALVARLEEFPISDIEFADGRYVVQYRGGLLPLLPAHEPFDLQALDPRPVIVFSDGRRSMGLMVDVIRDIVEDRLHLETSSGRPGVLGAAIIDGQATDLIDVGYHLERAFPDWFGQNGNYSSRGGRVLLVDDSAFFRNLLSPILQSAGYHVITAADGAKALERFERGERFDVVLSDIEMPKMDGFEMAMRIKSNPDWRGVPLLALTAHGGQQDQERGRESGYVEYLVKFDRKAVLAAVAEHANGKNGGKDA